MSISTGAGIAVFGTGIGFGGGACASIPTAFRTLSRQSISNSRLGVGLLVGY